MRDWNSCQSQTCVKQIRKKKHLFQPNNPVVHVFVLLLHMAMASSSNETTPKSTATVILLICGLQSNPSTHSLSTSGQDMAFTSCCVTEDTADQSSVRIPEPDSRNVGCSTPAATTRLLLLFPCERKVECFYMFFFPACRLLSQ